MNIGKGYGDDEVNDKVKNKVNDTVNDRSKQLTIVVHKRKCRL